MHVVLGWFLISIVVKYSWIELVWMSLNKGSANWRWWCELDGIEVVAGWWCELDGIEVVAVLRNNILAICIQVGAQSCTNFRKRFEFRRT